MNQTDVASEFRYVTALLAVKTGAAVYPLEDIREKIMREAAGTTFDDLLTRLISGAVTLGLWNYDASTRTG